MVKPYTPLPDDRPAKTRAARPQVEFPRSGRTGYLGAVGARAWASARSMIEVLSPGPRLILCIIAGSFPRRYRYSVCRAGSLRVFGPVQRDRRFTDFLWPFAFLLAAPIAYMWFCVLVAFYGFVLWILVLLWPFRFVIHRFKGEYAPPIPAFWSPDPSWDERTIRL